MLGHHLVVAQGHVAPDHVQSSVAEDLLEAEYVSSIDQIVDRKGVSQ